MKYVLDQIKQTFLELTDSVTQIKGSSVDTTKTILTGPFFQHAVANPLSSLSISISSAEKYLQSNKPGEALCYVDIAQKAASRIMNLFYLLDIENLQEKRFFNLSSALCEIVSTIKVVYPQTVLQITLPDQETYLKGNVFLFQEAILCLVINSIQAYTTATKPIVSIIVKVTATKCHITISDGGCGMSWLRQFIATETFFSSKKTGHGIGLRFSKNYVENMLNGQMKIRSKTGKGTQISLTIPLRP